MAKQFERLYHAWVLDFRERYLRWASEHLNGLFLSFNQEAYSPFGNVHQVCVPEVVKLFPRFKRLSRDSSWDRRGYVEEVYETT